MSNKGYSIITDFGCKTGCPYCIWRQSHAKENLSSQNWLAAVSEFLSKASEKVSVSGGGDPLNNWAKHQDFWNLVFSSGKLVDIHTSYTNWDFLPLDKIHRMVFHSNCQENYKEVLKYPTKLRVNFVIDPETNVEVLKRAESALSNAQLSYREYVGPGTVPEDVLAFCKGISERVKNGRWVQQADYNLYLFPDGSTRETYL